MNVTVCGCMQYSTEVSSACEELLTVVLYGLDDMD